MLFLHSTKADIPTDSQTRLPQRQEARSKRRSGRRERVCQDSIQIRHCPYELHLLFRMDERWITLTQIGPTVKDKANHAVILDKGTSDKLYKDVQSYRLITVATLVDRLKINGSLARKALNDLEEKGQIKKVVGHSKLSIYSMLYCLSRLKRIWYWPFCYSSGSYCCRVVFLVSKLFILSCF